MKKCPKCKNKNDKIVKNGQMNGKQRWLCKPCSYNFTRQRLTRTPLHKQKQAIKLYLEGNEFRGIERLTGIPHTTVMSWVKKLGERIEILRPAEGEHVSIMELDEMWHFVKLR